MLVDARGAERPPAGAGGDFSAFEVAEELGPFGVSRDAVFVGGPLGAAAGQERQVGLDGLLRVDGLVAEGDVEVAVPGDDLGDVRGQAVEETGSERFTSRVEYPVAGACCRRYSSGLVMAVSGEFGCVAGPVASGLARPADRGARGEVQ